MSAVWTQLGNRAGRGPMLWRPGLDSGACVERVPVRVQLSVERSSVRCGESMVTGTLLVAPGLEWGRGFCVTLDDDAAERNHRRERVAQQRTIDGIEQHACGIGFALDRGS